MELAARKMNVMKLRIEEGGKDGEGGNDAVLDTLFWLRLTGGVDPWREMRGG